MNSEIDCGDVTWARGYRQALHAAGTIIERAADAEEALHLLGSLLGLPDREAGPRVHRLRGRLVVVAR